MTNLFMQAKVRWLRALVCACGAMIFLGIAGCRSTQAPSVRVVDASVVESTSEATTVSFLLELENPNSQPLPLREFTYSLTVNGRPVLNTRRSAEATLPQRSSYTMILPAVVSYADYGDVPIGLLPCVLSGQLTYVAPTILGEVLFDMEIQVPSVGFSGVQEVDFSPRQADASP